MDFDIQYWHWLVFGIMLCLIELIIPSFTILWFGLGAGLTALVLLAVPDLSLSLQLFTWSVLSIVATASWFYGLKGSPNRTTAGLSDEIIQAAATAGESGLVTQAPTEDVRGMVRFTTPLLGNCEWLFICHDPVEVGDRVTVKSLSGNTLIVEKR